MGDHNGIERPQLLACQSPVFARAIRLPQLAKISILRTFNGRCVPGAVPPPILKPQLFSVGAFSYLLTTTPVCLRGFLRKPADFARRPPWPYFGTFLSLQAILLSGLAFRKWLSVRKGMDSSH
jgi:hypothetical protein